MDDRLMYRREFSIGGEWVEPAGSERFDVISPSTEAVVGQVPVAVDRDIDRRWTAARAAFDDGPWPRMAPAERADLLERAAAVLRKRESDIAGDHHRRDGLGHRPRRTVPDRVRGPAVRLLRLAHPHLRLRARGGQRRPGRTGHLRAPGCGGRHRALERPGHPGLVEDRPGPGRRVHRGAQAAPRGTAEQLRAGRGPRRGRHAPGRDQRGPGRARRWASTWSPIPAPTRSPSPDRRRPASGSCRCAGSR